MPWDWTKVLGVVGGIAGPASLLWQVFKHYSECPRFRAAAQFSIHFERVNSWQRGQDVRELRVCATATNYGTRCGFIKSLDLELSPGHLVRFIPPSRPARRVDGGDEMKVTVAIPIEYFPHIKPRALLTLVPTQGRTFTKWVHTIDGLNPSEFTGPRLPDVPPDPPGSEGLQSAWIVGPRT